MNFDGPEPRSYSQEEERQFKADREARLKKFQDKVENEINNNLISNMRIFFKYASRSRPDRFFNGLNSIVNNCATMNYTILITLDTDDTTMNNNVIKSKLGRYKNCVVDWGTSTGKIDAINRGLNKVTDWDILVNMSDDMEFVEKGFDNIIREDMQKHFPDLDGCLHYNDFNQKARVCSMSIMGRKYFNRFGWCYYPRYKSMLADDDFAAVATNMGRLRYMGDDKIIFKHLHHSFGLSEQDPLYKEQSTPEIWQHDIDLFETRKRIGFKL